MPLYLAQHGKSYTKEESIERGLSEEGRFKTEQMAKNLDRNKIKISKILHSGKNRAIQTAEIFSAYLNPQGGIKKESGINPNDDVTEFARTIKNHEDTLIVGHLPFLEKLASLLITDDCSIKTVEFQNSCVLCLDYRIDCNKWIIKFLQIPQTC